MSLTLPAIINRDSFEVGFTSSKDTPAGKSALLVDLNGSKKSRKLDMNGMGTNSQINNLGLMTQIGNTKILSLCGISVEYTDVFSRTEQLKIDIVRAFGSEVATMGDFINEIVESLSEFSALNQEQQDNLFAIVTEIITLKNLSKLETTPQGQERINTLIAKTALKIADMLIDSVESQNLSLSLAIFTKNFLTQINQKFDIPTLADKLTVIDALTSPENKFTSAVTEMIIQLQELLDNKTLELEEEKIKEIEMMIEQLEKSLETLEPLPRSLIKQLSNLNDILPETFKGGAEFTKAFENLKEANIAFKSLVSGLSIAQIRLIENICDTLEKESNPSQDVDSTIEKLDGLTLGKTLNRQDLNLVLTIIQPLTSKGHLSSTIPDIIKDINLTLKSIQTGLPKPQIIAIDKLIDDIELKAADKSLDPETRKELAQAAISLNKNPHQKSLIQAIGTQFSSLFSQNATSSFPSLFKSIMGAFIAPQPMQNPIQTPKIITSNPIINFQPRDPAPFVAPAKPDTIKITTPPSSNPAPVNPRTPEKDTTTAQPSPPVDVTPKEPPKNPNLDVPETDKKPTPDKPKEPDTISEGKKPEQVNLTSDKTTPENPPSPEGEKPKPENPPKQEGCEGVCLCDKFNNEAKKPEIVIENGKIIMINNDGGQKVLTEAEIKKYVETERKNLPPEISKNLPTDPIEFIKHITEQRKKEAENNQNIKPKKTTVTDNKILDDAIRGKIEQMAKKPQPPLPLPTTPPLGPVRDYPTDTGPKIPFGHVCGPNCNHGPAEKPAAPITAEALTETSNLGGFKGKSKQRNPK